MSCDSEDSLKPGAQPFPPTSWSLIAAARGNATEPEHAQKAIAEFCRNYWFPLYFYLRANGHDQTDAEDLTQTFFEQLLRRNLLQSVDQARGKLRSFLLIALKEVIIDDTRRRQAQKRGSGVPNLSFDHPKAEERFHLHTNDSGSDESDTGFDRVWARQLFDQAMDQVGHDHEKKGRGQIYTLLKPFITQTDDTGLSYGEAATKLELQESSVRVRVFRMRKSLRDNLEKLVLETVSHPDELEEEVRYLLSLL